MGPTSQTLGLGQSAPTPPWPENFAFCLVNLLSRKIRKYTNVHDSCASPHDLPIEAVWEIELGDVNFQVPLTLKLAGLD